MRRRTDNNGKPAPHPAKELGIGAEQSNANLAASTDHYSRHAEAVYEQCPWDPGYVAPLYPIIGDIHVDGEWHAVAPHGCWQQGRYRVLNGYFQAVFAWEPNPTFQALLGMSPMPIADDWAWTVWALGDNAGYAVSSMFAITPGQFQHQPAVDDWLWRFGLGLEPDEWFVEGAAYFTDLDAGCMTDAVRRLAWLERALTVLNQELEATGKGYWERLEAQVPPPDPELTADEMEPLPDLFTIRTKWRERIPPPHR